MFKKLLQILLIASGLILASSSCIFPSECEQNKELKPTSSWNYSETQIPWCSGTKNLSIKAVRKLSPILPEKPFLAVLTQDNTVLFITKTSVFSANGTSECLNYTFVRSLSDDKSLVCYDLEVFQSEWQYDIVADCFQTKLDLNLIYRLRIQNKLGSIKSISPVTVIPTANYYPQRTFTKDSRRHLRVYTDDGNDLFYRFVEINSLGNTKRWHIEQFMIDVMDPATTGITPMYHLDSKNMPIENFVIMDFYPFEEYWLLVNHTSTILTVAIDKKTLKIVDQVTFPNSSFQNMKFNINSDNYVNLLVSYTGATGYLKIKPSGKFERKLHHQSSNYSVLESWLGDTIYIQFIKNLTTKNCSVNVGQVYEDKGAVLGLRKPVSCPKSYSNYLLGVQFKISQTDVIKIVDGNISIISIHTNKTDSLSPSSALELLDLTSSEAIDSESLKNTAQKTGMNTGLAAIIPGKKGNQTDANNPTDAKDPTDNDDPSDTDEQTDPINQTSTSNQTNATKKSTNKVRKLNSSANNPNAGVGDPDPADKKYRWWFIVLLGGIVVLLLVAGIVFVRHVRRKDEETPEYAAVSGMDALA